MMNVSKLNDLGASGANPSGADTILQYGDGLIGGVALITFDATAVGGIAGTTYDPTNHLTTSFRHTPEGFSTFNNWGFRFVENAECFGSSSDTQVPTGKVKVVFNRSGQYLELRSVGGSGADPIVQENETELLGTAGILNNLFLTCVLFGRGTTKVH